MAKVRTDAWWAKLKPAERDAAYEACLHLPFGQGAALLGAKFGVTPGSSSAYYRFFEQHAPEYTAGAPVRAAIAQRYVEGVAERSNIPDDAILATIKSEVAAAQMNPGDPESLCRFAKLFIEMRRLQLETERQRLDREKFEASERRLEAAKGAVSDAQLTDAERVEKVKSIFGIK